MHVDNVTYNCKAMQMGLLLSYGFMPLNADSLCVNHLPCETQLHLRFINCINKAKKSTNNIV